MPMTMRDRRFRVRDRESTVSNATDHAQSAAADPSSFAVPPPRAPRWRRWIARSIDLTVVAIALALFLTPVVATHETQASWILKASAWVYVAVFVGLALSFALQKRNRPQQYVTVGMSIMDLRPFRVGKTIRLVLNCYLPKIEGEKRGRAAAATVLPLMLLGILFIVFEVISYT